MTVTTQYRVIADWWKIICPSFIMWPKEYGWLWGIALGTFFCFTFILA